MKTLYEGWVKFKRLEFKNGFIDYWVGDTIDNPNNKTKNNWNLNSMASYYRLNGEGAWINKAYFKKEMIQDLSNRKNLEATTVWKNNKIV